MGKTQSYLRGKLPSWGKDAAKEGNLKGTPTPKDPLQDRILGTIYGNCIGDAIGLMTEFLSKEQATKYFGGKHLEYSMKEIVADHFLHQMVFAEADWTDDTDQMILILQSLMDNNGKADALDFAGKLLDWKCHGFPELGDTCGMGVGQTTWNVLHNQDYQTDPHKAACNVWEKSNRCVAPNGGVMRTSIVGVHRHDAIEQVISNTKTFCKVTHADPRCIASCIAVTTAIAMMLQGLHKGPDGRIDAEALTEASFGYAKECLLRDEEGNLDAKQVEELRFHMNASLPELQLDDRNKIGYTLKCLGAGFWALRQTNFRNAIEELILEGGDADTNGAVAGALLGCKLGSSNLPPSWRDGLKHKQWLDDIIARYLKMGIMLENCGTPVDGPKGGIFNAKPDNPQPATGTESEGNNYTAGQSEAAAATTTTTTCSDGTEDDPEGGVRDQGQKTLADGKSDNQKSEDPASSCQDSNGREASGVQPAQGSDGAAGQAEVPGHSDLTSDPSEVTRNSESSCEAETEKVTSN